jgi:hypothetical protein
VGDHTEEWFRRRGPLAMAVVEQMTAAGVYVFAGGLEEEDGPVDSADPTSGTVMVTDAGWTWPMTRRPPCGQARSRRDAAGPMRFGDRSYRSSCPRSPPPRAHPAPAMLMFVMAMFTMARPPVGIR